MSVKAMGAVWDLKIASDQKFVLLAYADHADHNGLSIYPAVSTIAEKTGYSERSVQRITRLLENAGLLIEDGKGPHGTNKWRIPMSRGVILSPLTKQTAGVTSTTERGDIVVSPEPSFNHHINQSTTREEIAKVFKAYENEIGILTPHTRDAIGDYLDDLKIPSEWVLDAIHIAAEHNKRNWAYCAAILKRWAVDGKTVLPPKINPKGPKYPNKGTTFMDDLAKA